MTAASKANADPRQNQLLCALLDTDWAYWLPQLEQVELRAGQVLHDTGSTRSHLYFPTTAVVSMLYLTLEGQSAEIAVVGHDGVVGISLVMGSDSALSQALVHSSGHAYRLRAQAVKAEIGRSGPVFAILLRYTQSLIAQVTQTAACNRFHSIEQQFSRRLLVALDRASSRRTGDDSRNGGQPARRAPRRRDRGCAEVAASRSHQLQPGPHLGARPNPPRAPQLRVLCGDEEGTCEVAVQLGARVGARDA